MQPQMHINLDLSIVLARAVTMDIIVSTSTTVGASGPQIRT
jgi:hypothetical protein